MTNPEDEKIGNVFVYAGGRRPRPEEGIGVTRLTVAEGTHIICNSAFDGWSYLKTIKLARTVRTVCQYAFANCRSLVSIDFPDELIRLGNHSFYGCDSLLRVSFSSNNIETTGIQNHAFAGCSSLKSIEIPNSVTSICWNAFQLCSSLSKVILPPTIQSIATGAFSQCEALTYIKLHNGIQEIDHWAFDGCKSLQSIQIPPSVTSVGSGIFSNCESLTIVYISARALQLKRENIFYNSNNSNIIILTDVQDHEIYPKMTIHDIQRYIIDLPDDQVRVPSLGQQLQHLHHVLQQINPTLARRAKRSKLNLLHLLVYFPDDIYQPLLDILTKCPRAASAVDIYGRTPIHHAFTSTKQNMIPRCYDLLLQHSPSTIVHEAIRSGLSWDEVAELVKVKINALSIEDGESRLVPFMMVAVKEYGNFDVTAVYELLILQPDVLELYKL